MSGVAGLRWTPVLARAAIAAQDVLERCLPGGGLHALDRDELHVLVVEEEPGDKNRAHE